VYSKRFNTRKTNLVTNFGDDGVNGHPYQVYCSRILSPDIDAPCETAQSLTPVEFFWGPLMNVRLLGAAIIAAGAMLTANASAAPLVYDEAVDGDIAANATIFNLDFGINTVSGTVSGLNTNIGFDADFFDATLPANAILESIQLTVTAAAGGNGFIPNKFQYSIDANPPVILFPNSFGGNLDISLSLAAALLETVGLNGIQSLAVADYQITINVSEASVVPIPAALPLFLGGLGMMGFVGKRKKRV
jgi:hypothetical protein